MDDHQTLPPLAFQADDVRQHPPLLRGSITTADAPGPHTVQMVPASSRRDRIDTLPLALPLDMLRACQLTAPVLRTLLPTAGQYHGAHAMVTGRVGIRDMPRLFELLHTLHGYLRALFITLAMETRLAQLQDPLSDRLPLFRAGPSSFLHVRDLLCLVVGWQGMGSLHGWSCSGGRLQTR